MNLTIYTSPPDAALVVVQGRVCAVSAIDLSSTVKVDLTASREIASLQIDDTSTFGKPFDDVAALKAIAWAQQRLSASDGPDLDELVPAKTNLDLRVSRYAPAKHASVYPLTTGSGQVSGAYELHEYVHVELTDDGQIYELILSDLDMWGDPFDDAAAERALTWARAELARGASA